MKKIRNNEIFLSYSWNDTKIADNIDNLLKKHGIVFNRDKNDIDTWGSIRKYMSSIRKTDYALIIISESYLKSVNCMYEILELMKENEYKERILTVILNSEIYNPERKADYIKYWENKYKKLEKKIRTIKNIENITDLTSDLKRYRQISLSIGEFLALITDLNNPKIEDIEKQILNKLKKNDIPIYSQTISGAEDFLNNLNSCKYIELARSPENPEDEKKYKLENYSIDYDIHGMSIKFFLTDTKSSENIELRISDISNIEKNNMESDIHKKFYFHCKNRIAENEYNNYIKLEKHKNNQQEKNDLLDKITNMHRCILWF